MPQLAKAVQVLGKGNRTGIYVCDDCAGFRLVSQRSQHAVREDNGLDPRNLGNATDHRRWHVELSCRTGFPLRNCVMRNEEVGIFGQTLFIAMPIAK